VDLKKIVKGDIERRKVEKTEEDARRKKFQDEMAEDQMKQATLQFAAFMGGINHSEFEVELVETDENPWFHIKCSGLDFKIGTEAAVSPMYCWAPDQTRARGHWVKIQRPAELEPWFGDATGRMPRD